MRGILGFWCFLRLLAASSSNEHHTHQPLTHPQNLHPFLYSLAHSPSLSPFLAHSSPCPALPFSKAWSFPTRLPRPSPRRGRPCSWSCARTTGPRRSRVRRTTTGMATITTMGMGTATTSVCACVCVGRSVARCVRCVCVCVKKVRFVLFYGATAHSMLCAVGRVSIKSAHVCLVCLFFNACAMIGRFSCFFFLPKGQSINYGEIQTKEACHCIHALL